MGHRAGVSAGHGGVPPQPAARHDAGGDAVPAVVLPALVRHDSGGARLRSGGATTPGGGDLDGVVVRGRDQAAGGAQRVGGHGSCGGVAAVGGVGGGAAAVATAAGVSLERRLDQGAAAAAQATGPEQGPAPAHLRLSAAERSPTILTERDCHMTRKAVVEELLHELAVLQDERGERPLLAG